MSRDPDQQVAEAATGLGCFAFVAAMFLLPFLLPAFILYRLAVVSGATNLHPALLIALAAATIWGIWKLGGVLIRSVSPLIAQLAITVYVAACYTFVVFQRELTTARAELDLAWLSLAFAVFCFIGWKVSGAIVLKAHRDQAHRLRRKEAEIV